MPSKVVPGNSGGIFERQKSCPASTASFSSVKSHAGRLRRHFLPSKVMPGNSSVIFNRQKWRRASHFPFLTVKNHVGAPKNPFISPFHHGISRKTNISVGRRCRDAGVDSNGGREGGAAAPPYHFRHIPCQVHNPALAGHPSSSILLPSKGRRRPERARPCFASPSPLSGERAGVRGASWLHGHSFAVHPSSSILLPSKGRRRTEGREERVLD